MKIEKVVLAEEIQSQNPGILREIEELFQEMQENTGEKIETEFVPHKELKERIRLHFRMKELKEEVTCELRCAGLTNTSAPIKC